MGESEVNGSKISGKSNIIQLESITKIYRLGTVDVTALDGVDLEVIKGDFIAIMGPSGSGKSTLMNVIGCLDALTTGTYFLEGKEVSSLGDSALARIRNRQIGFVFQTYNLLPRLTALQNVELPLIYGGTKDRRSRSMEALEQVGLVDRASHKPAELSGGQQQRVGIARALVTNPAILLADEPTGNLDSRSSSEIMELIETLNHDSDLTVVLVTHEGDIAARAGRIITLVDGKITADTKYPDSARAI
ncbi:MAG: ABC transporter ATP-binding protein [SAR202 cluster bacterium]|nr:ABC transporter ATP-binding protein [SAR202 cluster bacterium]